MDLKDQVVSLEYAKKLKELGFEQESLFYWQSVRKSKKYEIWNKGMVEQNQNSFYGMGYSAYTVAELGEMLPAHYASKKLDNGDYMCYETAESILEIEKTEANARAKCLIYLKENKLI